MSFSDLVEAYFSYPAIRAYLFFALTGAVFTVVMTKDWLPVVIAVAVTPMAYALSWYLLHRFVLHGSFLYKSPRTASLWKRIHFDHHRDPNDLEVLFGALPTTLPTILMITLPVGGLIGGLNGAVAALTMGMLVTCFYEFCHCIQHLAYVPKSPTLKKMKKLHMAHHFHNENGNYGITNFWWDHLLGTFYAGAGDIPRSPTVFNLGYVGAEYERFPWVAELTGQSALQEGEKNPPEPANPKG
ncbi:MAG: sterol desaturase family protein [Candidatus Nitrohelix vancouverensis]|uniref:Sterol desaturase family protein n=1 Tax=Candidatus Nitrohelix vancouverensis TaxID=2705534 RepID=A0A7T0G561_9BACT|nr:MAG: sterol desaturase family protein [Candidatus Nitrohelix vancouverensis]